MNDTLCCWCRRSEEDHAAVDGHEFALRCRSRHDTGHKVHPFVGCMDAQGHDGLHENGTWRWADA